MSKDTAHIISFDGTNYPSWKYGILMFLEKQKLTGVVDGSEGKPDEVRMKKKNFSLCIKLQRECWCGQWRLDSCEFFTFLTW